MKSYSKQPQAVQRRKSALTRLQADLAATKKRIADGTAAAEDPARVERMEKEIEILQGRI